MSSRRVPLTTSPLGPLPLVVGVTGHRDLRPDDVPALEERVAGILGELQDTHPHTPMVVLSALAEGADRLAARVALTLGVRLVAPLPFTLEEYGLCGSDESRRELKNLLAQAEQVITLPALPLPADVTESERRDHQYACLSAYLARQSQILVALWDGAEAEKLGGTRQTVRFQLEGVPEPYGPPRSPLDAVETGPVYHIVTPRSQGVPPADAFNVHSIYPPSHESETEAEKAFARIFARMDDFNRDALHLQAASDTGQTGKSRFFPDDASKEVPASVEVLAERQGVADELAMRFQGKTRRTLLCLLVIIFAAAFLFGLTETFPDIAWLKWVYLGVLFLGYLVHLRGRKQRFEDKYLDYRALAEALRIQVFWRLAGLGASVVDHYLRTQRSELDWIRHALRGWATAWPDESLGAEKHLRIVQTHWIEGQRHFFANAGSRDFRKLRRYERWAIAFFVAGLLWALAKVFFGPAAGHVRTLSLEWPWAELLLASVLLVGLAPIVAGLLHGYVKTMALSEHAKEYSRMQVLYANAEGAMAEYLRAGELQKCRALVLELGIEALAENADWVLLHRDRPLPAPGL